MAELLVRLKGKIVAEGDEDSWVAPVVKPVVAESIVVMVRNEKEGPAVVYIWLGKRRWVDGASERRVNKVGDRR